MIFKIPLYNNKLQQSLPIICNNYQKQMLTETSMKIISHSNNHLTLQLNNCNKLIYKQYTNITLQTQHKLMHLLTLKHQHILPIHKIQRFQNNCGSVTLGIYYQYYAGLDQFLVGLQGGYEEQQVVNTFQPIIQAVQYLINNGYTIAGIKQTNIVITQNQQIKFVDNCLLDPTKNKNQIIDKTTIYEELSTIIFNILMMQYKEKCFKSWKSRLQILKRKFSKDTYNFFMAVFNKSVVGPVGLQKTKKISKKQRALQGKQNKIISANN